MKAKIFILVLVATVVLSISYTSSASATVIPDWVKEIALWYGEDKISEEEFINGIKFLLENKIIVLDYDGVFGDTLKESVPTTEKVLIPNGNSGMGNSGFYIPLYLEIKKGSTVVWVNDDQVAHTIQSQDGEGNVISIFNSGLLKTGDRFAFKFEESGVYNYFCSIHPWRVGVITIN